MVEDSTLDEDLFTIHFATINTIYAEQNDYTYFNLQYTLLLLIRSYKK